MGYHGSSIRTPNLDRLARRGLELDRHYVCPVIRRPADHEDPVELFRIDEDPCEQRNLADDHPDVVKQLSARIEEEHARDDSAKRPDVA